MVICWTSITPTLTLPLEGERISLPHHRGKVRMGVIQLIFEKEGGLFLQLGEVLVEDPEVVAGFL